MTRSLPFAGASARDRLIVALDAPSLFEAQTLAERVAADVGMLKVGLELFVEAGHDAVRLGARVGLPVFLDLKLHDIPETVERAVGRACSLGARLLTVHASGGPAMLSRAVRRAEAEGEELVIVAVTVLTSLDARDLHSMGIEATPIEHARRLARMAYDSGVRAFVCSPNEAAALRSEIGDDANLITPGVRPSTIDAGDDQKRVATPGAAIAAGADALVVGRPIRDAKDPAHAARLIVDEIASARQP